MAVVGTGLVLAGCGTNVATSVSANPAGAVQTALNKTSQAGSFRLTWIYTSGPAPLTEYGSMTGVVDLIGDRLKVSQFAVMGPDAKLGPGGIPPKASAGDSETGTMIDIGPDLWLSNRALPNTWLHQSIRPGKVISGLPIGDPGQVFAGLKAHLAHIVTIGQERLDGVEVSHYRGVQLPSKPSSGTAIPPNVHSTVDLWIDGTGLVRQLKVVSALSYPATPNDSGQISPAGTSTETISANFFDFGVRVDIQPPPPNEVTPENG